MPADTVEQPAFPPRRIDTPPLRQDQLLARGSRARAKLHPNHRR